MEDGVEVIRNRVIERRGSRVTEHTRNSHEEAVALAAELEAKAIAARKRQLELMERYSSPDHPATPVMPPASEIAEVIADYETTVEPGASEHDEPDEPDADPEAEPETFVEQGHAVLTAWAEGEVPIVATFAPEENSVKTRLTLLNEHSEPIVVYRSHGPRSGTIEVPAGAEESRLLKVEEGEELVLRVGDESGPVIARYSPPADKSLDS